MRAISTVFVSTMLTLMTTTARAEGVWYHCGNPQGYYPYVRMCNGPWHPVPAQTGTVVLPQYPTKPPLINTQESASREPRETCDAYNKNGTTPIDSLNPISCVSPGDISEMGFHVSSIPLSAARPEVSRFIATVNDRLAQAKAGHRLSDAEMAKDRNMGNTAQVLTSIGYPSTTLILQGRNAQIVIDDAFMKKAFSYIESIDAMEMSVRAKEQQATAAAESAKQLHAAEINSAEKDKRRAELDAHQWRSGSSDQAAIFSFMGVTFGDSTRLEAWSFSSWAIPIPGHPEIKLQLGTPNNALGYTVIVTRKNDKNVGLVYTFPFTQSTAVAKRLFETYGNPDSTTSVEW